MSEPSGRKEGMTVRPFAERDVPAIARLNARLRAAGVPHELYVEPSGRQPADGLSNQRLFLAVDGEEVRGGVFLREGRFWIRGETISVGWVKYPVAESLVDRAYAGVPAALLLQLMRIQPNLIAVGMGGHTGQFAQLLARLRWGGGSIDTWVCPLHPHTAAGALPQLRNGRLMRLGTAIARGSGAAALAGLAFRLFLRARIQPSLRTVTTSYADSFAGWTDEIWQRCAVAYDAMTFRDASALEWRYPTGAPGLARLRVSRGGAAIGWAVVQVVDLRERPESSWLGPLTVGVVLDAFALPDDAGPVMDAAMRHLLGAKADLAIANQAHPAWERALRRAGFLRGPANFAYYRSPALEKELGARGMGATDVMITRGDDGLLV